MALGLAACSSTTDTSTGNSSAVNEQSSAPADTSTPANDESNEEEEPIQAASAEPEKPVTKQAEAVDLSLFPDLKESLKNRGINPDDPNSIKESNDRELDKLEKEKGVDTTIEEVQKIVINELTRIDNLVKEAEKNLSGYDKEALELIKRTAAAGPGTIVTFAEQKALTSQLIGRLACYTYNNGSFPLTFEDMDVKDLETGGSKNHYLNTHVGINGNWIIEKDYKNLEVMLVRYVPDLENSDGEVRSFNSTINIENKMYTVYFEVIGKQLNIMDISGS